MMGKRMFKKLRMFPTRPQRYMRRAHSIIAYEWNGHAIVVSACRRCGWVSPRHTVLTETEFRRGIPCPVCNNPDPDARGAVAAFLRSVFVIQVD